MITPQSVNGALLAYLGDCVLELAVRREIIERGIKNVGEANVAARKYVTAEAQSAAVERILPHLSEDELAAYKRGRNHSGGSVPRHASACEYRRATGFEALFGFLELNGQKQRADELFRIAFAQQTQPATAITPDIASDNVPDAQINDNSPQGSL